MPVLREALTDAGFADVTTYLQSGNVVLSSAAPAAKVGGEVARLVADRFGLDISVIVRTHTQLAKVVDSDPLGNVATNPKLYLVTFLDGAPDRDALRTLESALADGEQLVRAGRELYTWHPNGSGRSKVAKLLSSKKLGVTATSRNWSTVTAVLELTGA